MTSGESFRDLLQVTLVLHSIDMPAYKERRTRAMGLLRQRDELNHGAKRIRTADPLHAMQVLYQLSYNPLLRL